MRRLFKKTKNNLRQIRHRRVRAKMAGSGKCPRLSVFRGLRSLIAQLIDDGKGRTLLYASTKEINRQETEGRRGKTAESYLVGKLLAEKAKAKKIRRVVFDRGGYRYHGRVKALAEGARDGGLEF